MKIAMIIYSTFLLTLSFSQNNSNREVIHYSENYIEIINHDLPKITTSQEKKLKSEVVKADQFGLIDGVYEKTLFIFRYYREKDLKVVYKNRFMDVYQIDEYCGNGFDFKQTNFLANGSKTSEYIEKDSIEIHKEYLQNGDLESYSCNKYIQEEPYMFQEIFYKKDVYYNYESQDSILNIDYYSNGIIKERYVKVSNKEHIDYWDNEGYYQGAHFFISSDSSRIRYDISIEGDTTKPVGWHQLNPITLLNEYIENK